jgi:hypothetical protein
LARWGWAGEGAKDVAFSEDSEQEFEAGLPEFLFAIQHSHPGRRVVVDAPDFEMKIGEALVGDFEGCEAGARLGHREPFRLVELDGRDVCRK